MLFMLQVWLYCVYSEVIGLSCCLNKAKTQLPVIHYLVLTLLLLFKKKKKANTNNYIYNYYKARLQRHLVIVETLLPNLDNNNIFRTIRNTFR